jgi:hypothetical protein
VTLPADRPDLRIVPRQPTPLLVRQLRRRPVRMALLGVVLLGGVVAASARKWDSGASTVSGPGADPMSFAVAPPAAPVTAASTNVLVGNALDPTGTGDVTAGLLAFLRRVPDGARVVFPPHSRYRVDGTIEVVNRSHLVLDGNGSEFFTTIPGNAQRAHWRLVGGSDLTLLNMKITGPNADGGTLRAFHEERQWQHGVDIRGVRRVLLAHVDIANVFGDCIYLGSGPTERWSEDVQVRDSRCRRNGRQGIAITAARRVLVEKNELAQIALMTFDVEPNGSPGGAADVRIRHNTVGSGPRQQFLGIGGSGPVDRVVVELNVLVGKALTVLVTSPPGQVRTGIAILENRSDTAYEEPTGAAMLIEGVRGLRIEDNLAPLSARDMALVQLTCTTSATVSGNTYPGGVAQVRTTDTTCPAGR